MSTAIGSSARSNHMVTPLSIPSGTSRIPAFDAPERGFGEYFNASSHSAVIRLVMHTFGARPADFFDDIQGRGDGYAVTMKDGYRLHLSTQELQQAATASRFTGDDKGAVVSAHFALAAFIKRKQLGSGSAGDRPAFESVLATSLQGETAYNLLKGMGMSGHLQRVSTANVIAEGGVGVADSYDFGSQLIQAGKAHQFGREGPPGRSHYVYVLVNDSAPKRRVIQDRVPPLAAPANVLPSTGPSTTRSRPQASEVLQGFNTPLRHFGEVFDLSSHVAVIKMMMLRFGRSPADMLEKIETLADGYNVTLKDGFEVNLSRQELALTAKATRFTGADAPMICAANFMLAAFAKRKQVEGNMLFDAALSKTLRAEHLYNVLKGMGLMGYLRFVQPDQLRQPGSVGVISPFDTAGALVVEGIKHRNGQTEPVGKDYGYQLAADMPVDPASGRPARFPAASVGVPPVNIWSGFYQGAQGNCVTVSAIKAAMMKYGQNPTGIYKRVTETPKGFTITMRDNCTVYLTHAELEIARAASNFRGADKGLVADAVFLYAASAKRAQLENHEFRAAAGYDVALQTLNDGESPGESLRRLGLYAFTRSSSVQELASGVPGTLADAWHSVVVVEGALDEYGARRDLKSSRWMQQGVDALKLV